MYLGLISSVEGHTSKDWGSWGRGNYASGQPWDARQHHQLLVELPGCWPALKILDLQAPQSCKPIPLIKFLYAYILLVLFFWRTLTCTDDEHAPRPSRWKQRLRVLGSEAWTILQFMNRRKWASKHCKLLLNFWQNQDLYKTSPKIWLKGNIQSIVTIATFFSLSMHFSSFAL